MLLSGARPKRRCAHAYLRRGYATLGTTDAEISLLLTAYSALNSPYPINAADVYYIRDSSCITLWLHHNHSQ